MYLIVFLTDACFFQHKRSLKKQHLSDVTAQTCQGHSWDFGRTATGVYMETVKGDGLKIRSPNVTHRKISNWSRDKQDGLGSQ